MNLKEQYLLKTWPKKQAKGKVLYMAYYALVYGFIVGAILLLLHVGHAPVTETIVSKEYLVKLVVFVGIGLAIAHFKWKANNRKHEEPKHRSDPEL